jgi:hypothetical protein
MGKALELVGGSRFEKAYVIRVGDGIIDVSPEAQAKWARIRTERGMWAYGVLKVVLVLVTELIILAIIMNAAGAMMNSVLA